MDKARREVLAALAVTCVSTAIGVFVLPLTVRMPYIPVVSASYVAGFNNRVAVLATVVIGVSVVLWAMRFGSARRVTPECFASTAQRERLPPVFLGAVVGATCLLTALSAWMVSASHLRYLADAGYFIEQMSSHAEYGRSLYSQLEFAYGPLLFYPTVFLHNWLPLSWTAAYFTTLALHQSAGLGMLAYFLNELPIRSSDRRAGLLILAFGAFNPLLGLNYTFLRFIAPFAALWFSTRSESVWRTVLTLAVSDLLLFGVSFELGLAFGAAGVVFAILRARQGRRIWICTAIAPVLGGSTFLFILGRPYLRMLNSFSHGALNLPVAPYPHILVFLFALVWLVPRLIADVMRTESATGIRMTACYALGLALLPSAFGRSDPLHVFFNGAGILVLSLAAIQPLGRRARFSWIATLLVLVLWEHRVNMGLYFDRTVDTVRICVVPHMPQRWRDRVLSIVSRHEPYLATQLRPSLADHGYELDLHQLQVIVGSAPVATPVEVSPLVEAALKSTRQYVPGYFGFQVDVMGPLDESKEIDDLNRSEWALIPSDPDGGILETPQNIDEIQGFIFPYRLRNPIPYNLGAAFDKNLDDNWTEVHRFGPYTLYHQSHAEQH
ncbi:MAG: hypothetical protein M3Y50_14575 [Acidobacteriota bacterium]|nr:hypothetical protein [Acidobacteriota bacterium]